MKTPQQILEDYREALRLNYGDEIADKSTYGHHRGWFYFELARRFKDGSCGVISSIHGPEAFRKAMIIARTEELNRRFREDQVMELTPK